MTENYLSFYTGAARQLLLSLAVTLAVELIVALLWKRYKKHDIFLVIVINFITNPIVNAILYICRYYMPLTSVKIIEYILEIAVLFLEWLFYKKYMREFQYAFLLALSANAASYGAGLLITALKL